MLRLVLVALTAQISYGVLDIPTLQSAFQSQDGLLLRITNLFEATSGSSSSKSTSAFRNDVPLALYRAVTSDAEDLAGIILAPGRSKPRCAYPVNANTWKRTKPGSIQEDRCGVMDSVFGHYPNTSGLCPYTAAREYADAYYGKPIKAGMLWDLEQATCHFAEVQQMFAAQKALLERCTVAPPTLTDETWTDYAGIVGAGLTAFNEVIVKPFTGADVGGVFWAHSGPFRTPRLGDRAICDVAKYGLNPFTWKKKPIFEVAQVNLGRPFDECLHDPPRTYPVNCVKKGLEKWQNDTKDGGYDPTVVFKPLSKKELFKAYLSVCVFHRKNADAALIATNIRGTVTKPSEATVSYV